MRVRFRWCIMSECPSKCGETCTYRPGRCAASETRSHGYRRAWVAIIGFLPIALSVQGINTP